MKKIIFISILSTYSLLILFLSSSAYLVGGSDILEFVYTISVYGKVISILGLFIFGYIALFSYTKRKLWATLFAIMFFLSILSSQSLVYSGKKNQILYSVSGISIDKIDFDPTGDARPAVSSIIPGLTKISYENVSLIYISLFFPFSLDASEIEDF